MLISCTSMDMGTVECGRDTLDSKKTIVQVRLGYGNINNEMIYFIIKTGKNDYMLIHHENSWTMIISHNPYMSSSQRFKTTSRKNKNSNLEPVNHKLFNQKLWIITTSTKNKAKTQRISPTKHSHCWKWFKTTFESCRKSKTKLIVSFNPAIAFVRVLSLIGLPAERFIILLSMPKEWPRKLNWSKWFPSILLTHRWWI